MRNERLTEKVTQRSSKMEIILTFFSFLVSPSCSVSLAFNFSTLSFDNAYSSLFGDGNLLRSSDGKTVRLLLDRYTGSGFVSLDYYDHGFFSASIKLPADYTAGVVVAFYTSNEGVFEKTHDKVDFEFLGNVKGKPWRVQTNVYGNESTGRGREERYPMWFDPNREFHRYSILRTRNKIMKACYYYIDDVPIREVVRSDAMGGDSPSKPMSVYGTIWNASGWATSGGRHKVNYTYEPFASAFTGLVIEGCAVDPVQQLLPSGTRCLQQQGPGSVVTTTMNVAAAAYDATITPDRRLATRQFRERFMIHSYCYDLRRYPLPPPECVIIPSEKQRFKGSGRRLKFGGGHGRSHPKRRSRVPAAINSCSKAAAV